MLIEKYHCLMNCSIIILLCVLATEQFLSDVLAILISILRSSTVKAALNLSFWIQYFYEKSITENALIDLIRI